MNTQPYTVIGIREGDGPQRWADVFEATDSADAERRAHDSCRDGGPKSDLLIAGVIAGEHACADTEKTYADE